VSAPTAQIADAASSSNGLQRSGPSKTEHKIQESATPPNDLGKTEPNQVEGLMSEQHGKESSSLDQQDFVEVLNKKENCYEANILTNLRQALSEQELVQVRDSIIEGMKHFVGDPSRVLIRAQLRKKHANTKNVQNFRGSKYRGPSKNRRKWQVMKMVNKETVRIGAIDTEQDAARIYDILAILTEGLTVSKEMNNNI
jgi:hypothetical protein